MAWNYLIQLFQMIVGNTVKDFPSYVIYLWTVWITLTYQVDCQHYLQVLQWKCITMLPGGSHMLRALVYSIIFAKCKLWKIKNYTQLTSNPRVIKMHTSLDSLIMLPERDFYGVLFKKRQTWVAEHKTSLAVLSLSVGNSQNPFIFTSC